MFIPADQCDWLQAPAQRSHRPGAAADVVIDAVERPEMDVGQKPFGDLLALRDPNPVLIVRYDYLWTHEAAAGHDQGTDGKQRRYGWGNHRCVFARRS